jgi:uncharacterized protein (TIGR03067 family)
MTGSVDRDSRGASMSTTRKRLAQPAAVLATFGFGLLLAGPGAARGEDKATPESIFHQLDKSGDGVLKMDEATIGTRSYMERIFKEAGKNRGEIVTRDEFMKAHERLRSKSTPSAKSPSGAARPTPSSPPAEPARADGDAPPAGIGFIDSNGDGSISRAEWSKFTQRFSGLDVDKDNSLSSAELEATGGAAELLMKLVDANGDGKISRTEWSKLAQGFTHWDENRDKSLDLAELQKVADAAVASASGSASLAGGKSSAKSGPTLWRGRIDGRGPIELVVDGNYVVGREMAEGGAIESLGAGTFTMSGDGKSGNMDAVYTEGDRAGQVCLGIYKFEGDTLLWCVNNKGGRPQEFSGGGGNWLLTLTRVDTEGSTKKTR